MIRAITFDLWNTLLVEKSYPEQRISILAEALGAEEQRVNWEALRFAYSAAQRRHDELWSKEHRHYPLAERLDDVLKGAGVTLSHASKAHVTERYGELIREDPPVLTKGATDTVSRLSPRFKLGIISDTGITTGNQIRRLFEDFGILHHFTTTVFPSWAALNTVPYMPAPMTCCNWIPSGSSYGTLPSTPRLLVVLDMSRNSMARALVATSLYQPP